VFIVEDTEGNKIPNIVYLDNTDDQNADVKSWVNELENRVKVISKDRLERLG